MNCPPCREGSHAACPELARLAANPDLARTQKLGGQLCDCQHKDRRTGGAAGSVRGQGTVAGSSSFNGPGPGVIVPLTHWWFDCDRWVGSL